MKYHFGLCCGSDQRVADIVEAVSRKIRGGLRRNRYPISQIRQHRRNAGLAPPYGTVVNLENFAQRC